LCKCEGDAAVLVRGPGGVERVQKGMIVAYSVGRLIGVEYYTVFGEEHRDARRMKERYAERRGVFYILCESLSLLWRLSVCN
jgi:hypothetical protein